MFVNFSQKKETVLKYCVTITFKNKEPITIFFPFKENTERIMKWFYASDADCLYLEYDIDPNTQEANERLLLERNKISKIIEEIRNEFT